MICLHEIKALHRKTGENCSGVTATSGKQGHRNPYDMGRQGYQNLHDV